MGAGSSSGSELFSFGFQ